VATTGIVMAHVSPGFTMRLRNEPVTILTTSPKASRTWLSTSVGSISSSAAVMWRAPCCDVTIDT